MSPKKSPKKAQSQETKKTASDVPSKKRARSATPPASEESLTAILEFLIHDAAEKFGTGIDAAQPNLFDFMKVSKSYTPFQNLVAAALMSKPISSRLGVRSLLTLFGERGDDINFSTPAKLRDAGEEGRYDALSKAKTQHKDKTALQLGRLADKVIEEYADSEEDTSLEKMHKALEKDASNLHGIIKDFYMFGDTAADIFQRRIQADWEEAYPFADERALHAAPYFGLAHHDAKALADQVKQLLPVKTAEDERRQFVTVVEALVAVDLEHKHDDLLEAVQGAHATEVKDDEPAEKRTKKE